VCKREREEVHYLGKGMTSLTAEIPLLTICIIKEHHKDYTSRYNLNTLEIISLKIILIHNSGKRK
jgi:hypothetical protein